MRNLNAERRVPRISTGPRGYVAATTTEKTTAMGLEPHRRQSPDDFNTEPRNTVSVPTTGADYTHPNAETPRVGVGSPAWRHAQSTNAGDSASKMVLMALAAAATEPDGIHAAVTVKQLSHTACCATRTVQRALRNLEARGFIRRSEDQPPSGVTAWDVVLPDESHDETIWAGYGATGTKPPRGTNVVYCLFDRRDEVAYVGSTSDLQNRLREHRTVGRGLHKWVASWTPTREAAYAEEGRLLEAYRPPMNRQLTAGGVR